MGYKKWILVICLLLLLVSAWLYIDTGSKNTAEVQLSSTVSDLWSEFGNDDEAAKNKYDGKFVIVTGKISELEKSFMGSPCILLDHGADVIPTGIFFFFQDGFDVYKYNVGDTVKIAGTCSVPVHLAGENNPYIFFYESEVLSAKP